MNASHANQLPQIENSLQRREKERISRKKGAGMKSILYQIDSIKAVGKRLRRGNNLGSVSKILYLRFHSMGNLKHCRERFHGKAFQL